MNQERDKARLSSMQQILVPAARVVSTLHSELHLTALG